MYPVKILLTIFVVMVAIMECAHSAPKSKRLKAKQEDEPEPQKFYEVDALGDDYVDFGAAAGPKGAYSWHATYRLEH